MTKIAQVQRMCKTFTVQYQYHVVNNNYYLVFQNAFVFIKSYIAWVIEYIVIYILETIHDLLTNEMNGGFAHTNPSHTRE